MPSVAVTDRGLELEAGYTPMTIHTADWEPTDRPADLPRPVDEAVTGRTACLRFPPGRIRVERLDGAAVYELSDVDSLSLEPAAYLVHVDAPVVVLVRFTSPATISTAQDDTTLSFPDPVEVTIGIRAVVEDPPGTVTVPESPSGLATWLTHAATSHRTATPDRSFPAMRQYPPLLEFGSTVSVPDDIASATADTDVAIRLPASYDYLFPTASLAHYLGADVTVSEDRTVPRIEAAGEAWDMATLPAYQFQTASFLRRAFFLDCLVRGEGPHGTPLSASTHLETVGLDAASLYDRSPGERFAAYLDAPFQRVTQELPRWHLSMYLDPTPANAGVLPHLLRDVPNVFLPASKPLETSERLTQSLDDFYRSADDVPDVDLQEPALGPGLTHGWLADGVPIGVFKTHPAAYEHRFQYRERAADPLRITVVCNDPEMLPADLDFSDVYQSETIRDVEVRMDTNLRVHELARLFESDRDFLHFVGHCDDDGLRCPDGSLATSSLSTSNVQAFFLNACGSYFEGLELVRKGSVAGAVTFDAVLDQPATRVGRVFAMLLVRGFDIQRALQLARRRIVMGKDYAVVGDGTHTLPQSEARMPGEARVERVGEDEYALSHTVRSPRAAGGQYRSPLAGEWQSTLVGTTHERRVSESDLRSFLDRRDLPVVFDGDIRPADAVREELRDRTE